jgi:hypothetical protein
LKGITMKTLKDDPFAEGRRLMAPLADKLARTGPDERRRLVEQLLPNATPPILQLLAELLVRKLEYRNPKVRDGAEEALVLLGTRVLPALECVILRKPSGTLLLRLAPLLAALGMRLQEQERISLQMALMIAANRAPTPDSAAALWAAVGCLRNPPLEPGEPFWPFALAEDAR